MSNAISGKDGTVTIGTKVAEIKGFTVTSDCNTPDVTSTDSNGWAEFVAGIKSWSGSFESLACVNLIGSVAVATFATGGSGKPTFSGTIIVKGPAVTLAVENEVRYSYNFQGSGPLTVG